MGYMDLESRLRMLTTLKWKNSLVNFMAGPKFKGVDDQCKYNPDIKKADTSSMLTFSGPVFPGLPGGSLYNEAPMKSPLDGQRLMTTPIFPGIKAENSFGPASMGF